MHFPCVLIQGLSECGPQASSLKAECVKYVNSPHPKPEALDPLDIYQIMYFCGVLT